MMRNIAFWCGSVRVVRGKKPEYSLLCAENDDGLSDGQRLRVMRLRAGLTIREAAETVDICRHSLMNYECGRTKVKGGVKRELEHLYQGLVDRQKNEKIVVLPNNRLNYSFLLHEKQFLRDNFSQSLDYYKKICYNIYYRTINVRKNLKR